MDTDDRIRVRQACIRISLLMEHQEVLPDLKDIALDLCSGKESEYLSGAQDALLYLIHFLEQKGWNRE